MTSKEIDEAHQKYLENMGMDNPGYGGMNDMDAWDELTGDPNVENHREIVYAGYTIEQLELAEAVADYMVIRTSIEKGFERHVMDSQLLAMDAESALIEAMEDNNVTMIRAPGHILTLDDIGESVECRASTTLWVEPLPECEFLEFYETASRL